MASGDKLIYFSARAKGEAICYLYILGGVELQQEMIPRDNWPARKPGE